MPSHRALGALLVLAGGFGCGAETRTSGNPPDESAPDAAPAGPASPDAKAPVTAADSAATPLPADSAAPPAPAPDAAPAPGSAEPPPVTGEGDDPPDRPLNVDKSSPQTFTFKFKPSEADPM